MATVGKSRVGSDKRYTGFRSVAEFTQGETGCQVDLSDEATDMSLAECV